MAACTQYDVPFTRRPDEPLLLGDQLKQVDRHTMRDKLNQLGLATDEFDAVEGMWATNFNGDTAEGGYSQALRWCALAGGSWMLMFEACATYKIQGGTRRLIQAMLADTAADVRLDAQVSAVQQDATSATVTLADGG